MKSGLTGVEPMNSPLLNKWLMWEGETGLIPSRHLPMLTNKHPSLMKAGSAAPFLQTTAYVRKMDDGALRCYKLIPATVTRKAFGISWSMSMDSIRRKVDKSIKVLEADEGALSEFFGTPLPVDPRAYDLAGMSGKVYIVDPYEGPPPSNCEFYEINFEYRYSELSWVKFQIATGICGQARVCRCVRGLGKRLLGENASLGLFHAMAEQIEQPISKLRHWMYVGAPLVRDDIINDDPLDWDFRRASQALLEMRSLLMLQQFEYLWEPHERWTEDQKKDFAAFAARMAKVKI